MLREKCLQLIEEKGFEIKLICPNVYIACKGDMMYACETCNGLYDMIFGKKKRSKPTKATPPSQIRTIYNII